MVKTGIDSFSFDEFQKTVFQRISIGKLNLKNRLYRSATWMSAAQDNGMVTPDLLKIYDGIGSGEIGLICTGLASVNTKTLAGTRRLGIHSDAHIPGLKSLVKTAHRYGGSIAIQLVDQREDLNLMSKKDIKDSIMSFAEAAFRAKSIGFDAVQIHAAHFYLISKFLSPLHNQRSDEYGGDVENRTRFAAETVEAIRNSVGENYPILLKINGSDYNPEGTKISDTLQSAKILEQCGLDAIEISGWTSIRTGINTPQDEGYFQKEAMKVKSIVDIPVILVGGLRSPLTILEIMIQDNIDLIAMSRPFITEPHIVKKWKKGHLLKSRCISCNKCLKTARETHVYCVHYNPPQKNNLVK